MAAVATPAAAALVNERKLLCAKIWLMTTAAREPTKSMALDGLGAEGARAEVYTEADMTRIDAGILGESMRAQLDYRYQGTDLVCTHEMHTSMHTILGGDGTTSASERPPAFWRVDFRVFHRGVVIYSTSDEAPGPGETHREADETLTLARDLLTRANAN